MLLRCRHADIAPRYADAAGLYADSVDDEYVAIRHI